MFQVLKLVIRNKIFYVLLGLIIIMFPSTLYLQSDKDKTIIVTTVGIDKMDDEFAVTLLSVIPEIAGELNANLQIFEGKGKTISEAINNVAGNVGKKVGLAHCDAIVLSKDVMQSNISKTLDYFVRNGNLTTNAVLVGTEQSSKKLLEATKSSNNLLNLSLKNIVMFQEDNTLLNDVTVDKFYKSYFSNSSTFVLPLLTTEESEEGSGSQGGSGSGGGSGDSSQQKLKIKNDSEMVVLRHGRWSRKLSEDEKFIYNLLSFSSKDLNVRVENVNDELATNSVEVYEQVGKAILPYFIFIKDKPVMLYNIQLSLSIDEISSTDNFNYSSITGYQNYLTDDVVNLIKTDINNKLENTKIAMRENNDDLLDIYKVFNAFHHKKWKKYLSTLPDEKEYLQGVDILIDINMNYVL